MSESLVISWVSIGYIWLEADDTCVKLSSQRPNPSCESHTRSSDSYELQMETCQIPTTSEP